MSKYGTQTTGFTLIEMMLALAIIGIMATMAVPSWREMIASQRMQTITQDFYASLMLARSEAIKLGQDVRIVAHTNGWADGWAVVIDTNPPNAIYKTYAQCVANTAFCLKLTEAKPITFTAAPVTTITFKRDGRPDGASTNITFSVCDKQNLTTKRSINTGLSGQPLISLAGTCP